MISALAPVTALLCSVALLLVGNGLQGTLLPVRANIELFAATEIGLIGTAYFIGFGLGCYFGGRVVRRAGHIRTFAAMAAIASTTALLHALFVDPLFWSAARCLTGFCFAVLYVVIESWLNERSTNETRGTVLSAYNMINLTMITVGQMMMTLYDPASFPLFILASIMVSIAAVPLAMTTSEAPAPVQIVRLRMRYLYKVSPLGCVGALAVGAANGSFWTLGPVFAVQSGLDLTGVALFMSAAVLAGAAGQWPLGRLSDRTDRRRIILGACLVSCVAGLATIALKDFSGWSTLIAVVVYGAFAFPLYSISIAHLNDFIPPEDFVEASSGALLLYAIGAAIGPIPSSMAMSGIGPAGLFAFTAVVHGLTAIFALWRMNAGRRKPAFKEEFVGVPRTSPTLYALDPRGEHEEDGSEADHGADAAEAQPATTQPASAAAEEDATPPAPPPDAKG